MSGGFKRLEKGCRFFAMVLIVYFFCFPLESIVTLQFSIPTAEAAQVSIDADAQSLGTSHLRAGSQTVFTDDQTGYKFFRDFNGSCVYRKTTNGGSSWSSTTTVDAQTDCVQIQVWYDKWTPGMAAASSSIHIATLDTSADDIFYNRLDTSGDSLLMGTAPVSMVSNTAQGGTIDAPTVGTNAISITRGTDGTIYAVSNDAGDSYVVECTINCNLAGSWTETGATPLDAANDYDILVPLLGGNIMVIDRDISLDDIRSKIWDNTAWSAAWTIIDGTAADNTTYDIGMAASVSSTTGTSTVHLAYIATNDTLGTNDQIRTARYSGNAWTAGANVTASTTMGMTNVSIGLDAANDDVYVAYTGRTVAGTVGSANVYWKWATSSMMNWSTESLPVNTSQDDLYGVDLNLQSDQRMYVSYFDNTDDDIYGDTIADIFPGVHASGAGTQIATANASTSNFYVGGKFLLYNTYKPLDVTGVTISESGTIDGSTNISNIKLFYETDVTAPYNCASESYGGSEAQFGSTDTNGFSGANGVSSFSGTTVNVSTTTSLCLYPVLTILDTTANNATIEIEIANPASDVTVTGGTAGPATTQSISGATTVLNDIPTLAHYHWRNDDGTETTATSKTGGNEDTSLTALQQGVPARLRMEVSNEGGSSTPAMQYRLEYAQTTGACSAATGWTDVGAANGEFDMYNTTNLTDGADTTNVALGANGAVTDENTTFLSPNGAVKDTSSQTANILLTTTQYVELEYSLMASTSAAEGNTYCFRVTDKGNPLFAYDQIPRANIAADVLVTATGTQISTTNLPATNFYVGGAFVVTNNIGSRNVTSITIAEDGTIDAQNDLSNIRLKYDLDTTLPYDCSSESYGGNEPQFGATTTGGFSGANGTSTFTGSVGITTTATMCVYTVLDSTATAQNGEVVNIIMQSPSTNLVVSGGGSVSPAITRDITGSTTFAGAVLTQTHYHWRNDNGNEAAATSLSGGLEDTPILNVAETTPVRLRMQVSNEGSVTSASRALTLEYGAKITTCGAVSAWINVGDTGGAWDMFNSTNLTEANDTTNIAVATGGVTDENVTFLTPNSAVKETSATVATTTLTSTQYIETEHSIIQTANAGFDITYCFRLVTTQVELNAYTVYPELTTSPDRDFEIQRGTATITGTSLTLTAGVDYTAPSASTSAFMRITNTHHTGAGSTLAGATQNADDVTAYISNPSNIMTSVTLNRASTATGNSRVSWEIVEFIGEVGSDNEMIVRSQTSLAYGTTATTATGTTATVSDDSDVVVFITGQMDPDIAATNYNSGQSTSAWGAVGNVPVFTRGVAGSDATIVSYAVVEFTGPNWITQRSEHTYTAAGTAETEAITAVGSLSRTFIHTQKRIITGLTGVDEFGHEVWLSSIGFVSYFLESGATTPSGQTSVAWIIENIQTSSGAMDVTRSSGSSNAGTAPLTISVSIGKTLTDISNASIFANSRSAGTATNYPRPIAGATIASTTHYELWRSNTGANLTYRTEIVEWPTAGLALRQHHFQFFVDNNALDPTDVWPPGGTDLAEDGVLGTTDEPLGEGEHIRIRMSIQAQNATFPAGTKSFRLQYGQMISTCTAISEGSWITLGDAASSTIWRGYNATGTTDGTLLSGDPPTPGDLNLPSGSDVAGTLEEENDTAVNTYALPVGEAMEFDWMIEQNGASAETYYCFRMVESDNTPLDEYGPYPQLLTASFSPKTQNWRWYDDEQNETPTDDLALENVSPIDITITQALTLRVTVKETKNIAEANARFKLQYSEYADFSTSTDLVASSTCIATSTWCYANGGAVDNVKITTATLSDADSCVTSVGNGCGTHNESSRVLTGFRHENSAAAEYSFTIQAAAPRVNRVYYFRLYDVVEDAPVLKNTGESYPSLVTEGASLFFTIQGVTAGSSVEGITTDITSGTTSIPFGSLPVNSDIEAAQRLMVSTNATEGYQIFMLTNSDFISGSADTIAPITGTNGTPVSWNTGCEAGFSGCVGYHAGDDTLLGGSTRFSAIDTYARLSTTTLDEIIYSSAPVTNETTDMVFKIKARQMQEAGSYGTSIRYIIVPIF